MALRSHTNGIDPYAVLGVGRGAEAVEIRARYRQLAAQHHPDRNPDDPGANARMGQINRAYALLNEPSSRARVDAELRRGKVTSAWRGGAGQGARADGLDLELVYAWLSRRMRRAGTLQRVVLGMGGMALQWLRDNMEGGERRR
jgi:molecular chaperone DnaJ